MRLRQSNRAESPATHAEELIRSDDVLSTAEQEEVLRYFAKSLRCSTRFLLVLGMFHLVLALVYALLLLSGSPLVYMTQDPQEQTLLANLGELLKKVEPEEEPPGRGDIASLRGLQQHQAQLRAASQSKRASGSPILDSTLHALGGSHQAKPVVDYLASRNAGAHFATLSVGAALSMLASILLFIAGGHLCYRTCQALKVDVEALVQVTPRRSGRASSSHGSTPSSPEKLVGPSWLPRLNRQWTLADGHYILASLSVWPTVYWVVSTAYAHHMLHRYYRQAGLDKDEPTLWLGITDSPAELLLILWQPVFHALVGYMTASIFSTRKLLEKLAHVKYEFEKL